MKICFLSLAHGPRDKRVVDKEAASLARAGFEVWHLCPDAVQSVERRACDRGIETVVYPRPAGIRRRLLAMRRVYRLACDLDADVYHCNEVDSWIVGCALKLLRRKRIVFDVHEHYPSTLAESRFPKRLRPLVTQAVRLCFHLLLPLTDRVVLAKRSVAADFRGAERKTVLVQNFVPLDQAAAIAERADGAARCGGARKAVVAVHLGLISKLRGWPQILDAMTRMQHRDLHLHVIGEFNDGSRSEFTRQVQALGLADRVTVEDWMPFDQAFRALLRSDIGLITFQPGTQNHVFALPHKMFDYMLARLPVVAPAFAMEVAEIVRDTDCGLLVDPSDPADLARTLDTLAADPALRAHLGDNGHRAVLQTYNWEAEFAKLERMYSEMAAA